MRDHVFYHVCAPFAGHAVPFELIAHLGAATPRSAGRFGALGHHALECFGYDDHRLQKRQAAEHVGTALGEKGRHHAAGRVRRDRDAAQADGVDERLKVVRALGECVAGFGPIAIAVSAHV